MRVLWWQTMARNESECRFGRLRWEGPRPHGRAAGTIDHSRGLPRDVSKSVTAATRKTVSYNCVGRSRAKARWRLDTGPDVQIGPRT